MGAFTEVTDYLSGGGLGDILGAAGGYALGTKNIEGAQELGQNLQAGTSALAGQARADTAFQPYAVTSGLANVATNQQGGFDIGLSPEQQAMQNQLMGQASGLFGQVGQNPAQAQAALYEQMRGVQRPDEQRQRLALEERMLSQGRLGLGSAAYGGSSPELLAQETAIQEAMGRANLGARQQSQLEQLQAGELGGLLQGFGYEPQQQALNMLRGADQSAGFADVGRRTGAELGSQLNLGGLEGRLNMEDLANRLGLQRDQGMLDAAFGQSASPLERAQIAKLYKEAGMTGAPSTGGLFGSIWDTLFGDPVSALDGVTIPTADNVLSQ